MKRSILRRGTARLERRTRLAPARATPRRSSRVRDEAYLAWLRTQPCGIPHDMRQTPLAYGTPTRLWCSGPIDPDHERAGVVGMGQKAGDRRAWPVCRRHHNDRHDLTGVFKGWTREQINAFIDERISLHNERYERHRAGAGAVPA